MTNKNQICFDSSQICFGSSMSAGEKMFGTAPNINFWILIEYTRQWEEKAFNNCSISKELKDVIRNLAGMHPKSRIQLIRRNSKSSKLKLYIAITKSSEKEVFEFSLDSYDQILTIDFEKALKNSDHISAKPLLLVCTHGSYDKCCGTMGKQLYNNLFSIEKDFEVWQTTHLGGHRLASNILLLPEGIYYGRVDEDNYYKIKECYLKNSLCTELLRGRCFYSSDEQAAEYFLAMENIGTEISNFRLEQVSRTDSGQLKTVFINNHNGYVYNVLLDKKDNAVQVLASCKDKHKKFFPQYELINITRE